ncbi:MAG TPA: hypothetical protein VNR18_02140 [Hyphomicrobiales bacterium]|nr:hypothetical protein [Hyphomicrobiales bacterium]
MAETDADEDVLEYADATRVRVLETNVLHVDDVVYWLDGASAASEADMNRIDRRLSVRLDAAPRDLRMVHRPGQLALWRRPQDGMIAGQATPEQVAQAPVPPFVLEGTVSDATGHFNPARFALTLGAGDGVAVVLYPTPLGVALSGSGGVIGSLRFAGSNAPAAWALLELEVELSAAETQLYRAQADRRGDFALALNRLPPLPQSATEYPALLRVRAIETAMPDSAPDTDAFVEQELEANAAADFSTQFAMAVRPGEIRRIQSFDKPYVAVQPA